MYDAQPPNHESAEVNSFAAGKLIAVVFLLINYYYLLFIAGTMASERKKSANFTACEVEVLVDEVAAHRAVLFGKFGSGVSNAAKIEMWKKITEKINAGNGERFDLWKA